MPLTADAHHIAAESKRVLDDGFRPALSMGPASPHTGILADEASGASILRQRMHQLIRGQA